jgi:hypothetical protein
VKSHTRLGATAAAAAFVTAASIALPAASAQAAVHPATGAAALSAAQTLATARINGRLGTLHALQQAVSDAAHLSSSDRSTLSGLLSGDISGLTTLRGKVAAETTVAAVHADQNAMVDDYRVYMLVSPKVRLADAFDTETAAEAALQDAYAKLNAKVAAAGGGTAQQKAELADMNAKIQAATQATAGQVATLLGIQPGPDASAIRGSLSPLVSDARAARKALKQARDDAEQLRAGLK